MSEELERLLREKEHRLELMKWCEKALWNIRQSLSQAEREYKKSFKAYRELLYKEWEGPL